MPEKLADRPRWSWYAAWAGVGFGIVGGVLAIFSIGIFLLVAAAFGAGRLLGIRSARASAAGLISGMGLPLLLIAFINRHGPGTWCTSSSTPTSRTESCSEQWNPWPWLGFGVLMVAMGAIEFAWRRRRADERPAGELAVTQRSTT
ncbi:MAG: hypothetical protein ABIM89_02560 [Mycobacteriales bacterium]